MCDRPRGKLLRIRLDSAKGTGSTEPLNVSEAEWRTYVGGGLLGAKVLLDTTPAGLDPYDPKSPLMFLSGAVTGLPYVGLARFSVVAKSPMSGGIGESRVAGPFGQALKASGSMGIIVTGRAPRPSYIVVKGAEVQVLSADDLWGLDTATTTERLCQRHGANSHVAAIGSSGERMVRFASIITDYAHPADRMGLGAVMGSKKVKALVLVQDSRPVVHDRRALERLTDAYADRMMENPLTRSQYLDPGFGGWLAEPGDKRGYAGGTANFQTSELSKSTGFSLEQLGGHVVRSRGGCPGCPNDCVKTFSNSVDNRAGSLHEETLAAFQFGVGPMSLDEMLDLNARCHLWGIDPVSLAGTVAFATEASQRGLTDSQAMGIPEIDTVSGRLQLVELIAKRDTRVQWLCDGVARAAQRIGETAEELAMHSKGIEMPPYDPRSSAGQALAMAVSPVGPRYEIVEHDIDFDPVDGDEIGIEQIAALGFGTWEEMGLLDSRRVARTVALIDLWSALDALGISLFAGPPMRELRLGDLPGLITAVTGWQTSEVELMLWGRRRWTLMRIYNLREGLGPKEDGLPRRFFEQPIDVGRHTGAVLDRDRFDTALQQYYELNGWDSDGIPKPSTLAALSISWAGEILSKKVE